MSDSPQSLGPEVLLELAQTRMPFGRYAGRLLIDLPEPYVVWFRQRGFPRGKLGTQLALLYEIKANGLEHLIRRIGEEAARASGQDPSDSR